jgi:RNA 3'-terminal phosphate cyclase (ATP)
LIARKAEAVIAHLPGTVAERELAALAAHLDLAPHELFIRSEPDAIGPGNCLLLTLEYEQISEVVTAFGRIGASSEKVAAEAASEAQSYLAGGAPVGSHLADQLILPMALASGGRFTTATASSHLRTNIEVVRFFLDADVTIAELGCGHCCVAISVEKL